MKSKLAAVLLLLFIVILHRPISAQRMAAPQGQSVSRGATGSAGSLKSGARPGRLPGASPSRSLRHSKVPRRQGVVVPGWDFGDGDVSVSIEQTQPSPALPAEKPGQKKYYVPPRWVAENGVEVLMPSFWTDDPEVAGVKNPGKTKPVASEY